MENNPPLTESKQVDYLASLEDPYFQMVHATSGQRFLNFLVDNLFMRFALSFITGTAVATIISLISPEFLYESSTVQNVGGYIVLSLLIGYLNYIIYYTLCEKLFKGYTLGKLITGTRAVHENGSELTFKDSLLRSLCRIVPFEAFSAFGGNPWHDSWTNTVVIKAR